MAFNPNRIANNLEDIITIYKSLVIVERSNNIIYIALAYFLIEEFLRSYRIK